MKELKRLIVEAKPFYGSLSGVGILSLISTGIGLTSPWLYRELINFLTTHKLSAVFNQIIPTNDQTLILFWLVGLSFGIDIVRMIVNELEWYIQTLSSAKAWYYYVLKSIRKLHEFSISYFEKKAPGWLWERIQYGTGEIYRIARSILVEILPIAVNFTVAVVVLFNFDHKLSLVFAVIAPLFIIVSIWRTKIMRYWEKRIRDQREKGSKAFISSLYNVQLVKEFGNEDYEQKRLTDLYQKMIEMRRRQENILRLTGILRDLISRLGDVWVYGYGGYLVLTNNLLVGDLVLFVSYLGRVMGPLGGVLRIYDGIQTGLVSVRRVFKIWDRKDEVRDIVNAKPLQVTTGAIKFHKVSFSYINSQKHKNEKKVFNNLNLEIKSKEVVALVGPSGSGKSTFIKLLLRFYDPTSGEILIDGQDIKTVSQKSLRQHISSVMQDVMVFSNTIGYNLRYGRLRANQQAVEEAAKVAHLYDFIYSLRQKFMTPVGERGIRLSGGEKQRLAIARAVLKNAPILVMDEATSALDTENEKKIQEAMWGLIKGRTTIIIAHRLSTIMRADRIIVFDQKGKIIEQGKHEVLMAKGGYYSRLFKMQGEFFEIDAAE